jgi:plasmid maintenance system antidote protein VapI
MAKRLPKLTEEEHDRACDFFFRALEICRTQENLGQELGMSQERVSELYHGRGRITRERYIALQRIVGGIKKK